jgi:amino acid permease
MMKDGLLEDGEKTGYDSTASLDEGIQTHSASTSDLVSGRDGRRVLPPPPSHGYIQAIGTPQSYQYHRVKMDRSDQSLDGYNNFDDGLQDSKGVFQPPPLVRTYSPWTPRGAALLIQDKIKAGSIKGSVFNMIISTVGGGMLSLPYGVREFGLIPGFLLLMVAGWLSYHTNDFLLIASAHLPKGTKPTHLTLSKACSPTWGRYLANFTQGMLLVQMFGGTISYNVAFGGLLDLVWEVVVPKSTHISNVYPWVVILMSWVIIYPLSLLRSMSALRFTSLLGFGCSTYLSLVLFGEYFALCDSKELKPQKTCFYSSGFNLRSKDLFNFTSFPGFLQAFLIAYPFFAFSFVNQQYALPVYVELTRGSRPRMQKVVSYSHWVIFIQYTLTCVFAFLSFLDGTCGNILLNDYHKRIDVVIAAIAISVSMILTQPITVYAWRMNFAEIVYKVKQLDKKPHVIITTVFIFLAMVVSLLVTDIATVFGVLGATTYPTIGFILPAVYLVNLVPKGQHTWKKRLAVFQAVIVAISSVASLVLQLYQMAGHDKNQGECHNVQTIKTTSIF